MPALPIQDGLTPFPIDQLNMHSFSKRCCYDCDCDDIDPAVPVVIVVVIVLIIVALLGYLWYRRRGRNGASSGGRRGFGGFGLMSSAWRAISSRGGDQTAAQSTQAWPGTTSTAQLQPSHTEMTTEPQARPQREGVWRPQSKTLSQLPPPPQYVEADPNPAATEDGLARMRSFNRDETSDSSGSRSQEQSQSRSPPPPLSPPERQASNESSSEGSPAPHFGGRTRGTNQQRMGGQGRVSMIPQRPNYE